MNGTSARVARIALVTLALSGAGAAAGAVLSVAANAGLTLVFGGISRLRDTVEFWPKMAAIGGVIGTVLGPSLAWLLLRRVPIGRAVLQCMLGALVGGVVGALLPNPTDHDMDWQPIETAVIGTVYAAVRLRLRRSHSASSLPRAMAPDAPEAVRPPHDAVR